MFHIKSFFLPHQHNNFHPYSTRIASIFVYLLIAIILNYVFVPIFGLSKINAQTSTISTSKLVDLLNYSRTSVGLGGLAVDQRLTNAAISKAQDMFARQYWAHFGPDGESPWQFIKGSDYNYIFAGENLAKGFKDAQSTHDAWMSSPTHRANILKKEYTNVGIAAVSGTLNGQDLILIVQMFGSPVKTTGPNIPQIISPLDGSRVYDKTLELKGIAQNNSSVDIYDNGEKKGTLLAQGGVFDFKLENQIDGTHTYNAQQGSKSPLSSSNIGVIVDTYPSIIDTRYLNIQIMPSAVVLNATFLSNIKKVTAHVNGIDIVLADLLSKGKVFIPTTSIKDASEMTLTLNDGTVDKGTYNFLIEKQNSHIVPLSTTASSVAFSQPLLNLNGKQQLNLILAIFVATVFGIDAYVIWKVKVNRNSGKSLFHFQNMFILIILILVGTGIGGTL